jgi:mono/diheme cytochrome c family protein
MNLTLLATPLVIALVIAEPPVAKDGERVKHLVGGKDAKVEVMPDLPTAASATLIARTAVASETLKSLRRYQADSHRIALIDAPLESATRERLRIGVALAPEGHLARLALFDELGKPRDEFENFFAQFRGGEGVSISEASAADIGDVVKRRDQVLNAKKAPPKPADKQAWVLLRHHRAMWAVGAAYFQLEQARRAGEPLGRKLDDLDAALTEVEGFAGNLTAVVEAKTVGTYRQHLAAARAAIEKARAAVDADDRDALDRAVKIDVKNSCGACHGSDKNEFRRPLEGAMRDKLFAAGFAKGSFVVGVDVQPRELDERDAQSLASAIKAALLAAREGR